MPVCSKCLKEKEDKDFYERKGYGLYSWCKECHKDICKTRTEESKIRRRARVNLWLKNNDIEKEKRRERDRKYKKEHRALLREKAKIYSIENKDKIKKSRDNRKEQRAEYAKRYRKDFTEKYKARNILNNELRKNKIKKGICEVCGSTNVEAHHENYNEPLKVKWLCRKHHAELHHK